MMHNFSYWLFMTSIVAYAIYLSIFFTRFYLDGQIKQHYTELITATAFFLLSLTVVYLFY